MCSLSIPIPFVIQHIWLKIFCCCVRLSWLRTFIKSSVYFFRFVFLSQFALAITERRVLNPFNYGSLFLPLILLVFISNI